MQNFGGLAVLQQSFAVEGVNVNCARVETTSTRIVKDSGQGSSFGVFTLNLDHVVKLRKDATFRAVYRMARYVTADGFPIVWAGLLSGAHSERVTGADLIEPICEKAAESGKSIFLFGSTTEALAGAAQALKSKYPKLVIAGMQAPELGFDPNSDAAKRYCQQIQESGASICFIALGAPKQEVFSATAMRETKGVGLICIGAGLDFLANLQVRAPRLVQKMGLEWVWRLLHNPRRLAHRYLQCALILPSVLVEAWRARSNGTCQQAAE